MSRFQNLESCLWAVAWGDGNWREGRCFTPVSVRHLALLLICLSSDMLVALSFTGKARGSNTVHLVAIAEQVKLALKIHI